MVDGFQKDSTEALYLPATAGESKPSLFFLKKNVLGLSGTSRITLLEITGEIVSLGEKKGKTQGKRFITAQICRVFKNNNKE